MANAPTRYEPASSFPRLPDVIDQLFRESVIAPNYVNRYFNGTQRANLLETNETYVVQLAVSGIDTDKLNIEIVGQQLVIKGLCTVPEVVDATYLMHGLFADEFTDTLELPMEVDGEKATASYHRGILTITMPKAEHAKPKTVKIQTAH